MAKLARFATRSIALAAALAAGVALAPAASAHSEKKDDGVTDLIFNQSVNTGTLRIVGDTASLLDLSSVTRTVDAVGRTLTAPQTVALRAADPETTPSLGSYACLPKSNGNPYFTQFAPVELYQDTDRGRVQGLFYVYRQANARKVNGFGSQSVQFEICGVGGSDPSGKARTRKVGLGITYPDTSATYKIGQAWQTGSTPANYTLNMDFKAAYKGVEIGGGMSQVPVSKLMGSISTPIDSAMDIYNRNAVNGWWQDSCVGSWHGCKYFHGGSSDFHGSVVQGLWEFSNKAQARAAANGGFRVSTFNDAR